MIDTENPVKIYKGSSISYMEKISKIDNCKYWTLFKNLAWKEPNVLLHYIENSGIPYKSLTEWEKTDHTLLAILLVDISIRIDKFDIEENAVIISVDGKNKIHI